MKLVIAEIHERDGYYNYPKIVAVGDEILDVTLTPAPLETDYLCGKFFSKRTEMVHFAYGIKVNLVTSYKGGLSYKEKDED